MILNAKILSADIYIEDHNILTFGLHIESSAGWHTTIGGFYLEWTDKEGKRVPAPYTSTVVRAILETVGVDSWSKLEGKYIRIDDNDRHNSPITKIANLMKDNWIDIIDFMDE